MKINALHKNGYLYPYDTNDNEDRKLWFEGRCIDDIVSAFNMDARENGSEYQTEGMAIDLKYADGLMDGSFKKENSPKEIYAVFYDYKYDDDTNEDMSGILHYVFFENIEDARKSMFDIFNLTKNEDYDNTDDITESVSPNSIDLEVNHTHFLHWEIVCLNKENRVK